MSITRRRFMKTAGTVALATMTKSVPVFSEQQNPISANSRIAVFFEPDFPAVDTVHVDQTLLQDALKDLNPTFITAHDLPAQLHNFDILIMPFGSAFPKSAWGVFLEFLRSGGNFVNLGGVPFSVPVDHDENGWHVEVRQTEYHKLLGITQAFPVSSDSISSYIANDDVPNSEILLKKFTVDQCFELYVRFTDTKDFPNEDGSGGQRDAVLKPLVFGLDDKKIKRIAPVIQIDHTQGDYAGGRWILANFTGTISSSAIHGLVDRAIEGSIELTARTSFACYHDGEGPSITVQLRRPKGNVEQFTDNDCSIEIHNDQGNRIGRFTVRLQGNGTIATGELEIPGRIRNELTPGLYHISVSMIVPSSESGDQQKLFYTTGFWIFDHRLLAGGKQLTVDANYLLRDGVPYPVTGTTYMASDVHRKFLLEPNPHVWDNDFRRMQSCGINMVRTGIWTAWKNYMLDVGAPNEVALRSMDAFILTARKYEIPVIITVFAFLPEMWGGINPYLDSRSVNAQKEFLLAFVRRYGDVKEMMWDFINEPSFCNPQQLWSCRPNYDLYEIAAWKDWLTKRYPFANDDERINYLAEIFRCLPDEAFSLPKLEEFSDVNIFNDSRPIKVIDYRLFAQEMFTRWAQTMRETVRANVHSAQLVTVGQDEGGTGDGPSPQFFADAVDFTCIHNWWHNDDLVWDNVMTRVPGKPNLVEETGVMFYEKMDGSAWRTEEDARNLLERKLAVSLGAGGAGFIEWVWNTNPYMASDNEAAIGLFRVDGTAKPEFDPVERFAKFFSSNRRLMTGKKDEDVLMVIPHSQLFSTRDSATEATQRCVRVMSYDHHIALTGISEYQISKISFVPKLIVAPSPRTLHQAGWNSMLALVERGSTLLITGVIDSDDHWLPVERMKQFGIDNSIAAVAEEEILKIDGVEYQLSFRGDKIQRIEKSVVKGNAQQEIHMIPHGKGNIIWSPLPVELAESPEPTRTLYQFALKHANLESVFSVEKSHSSILVLPTIYNDAVLCTVVSESGHDEKIIIHYSETNTPIAVAIPAQRSVILFISRKDGSIISSLS